MDPLEISRIEFQILPGDFARGAKSRPKPRQRKADPKENRRAPRTFPDRQHRNRIGSGDDALFDGRTGRVQSVLDAGVEALLPILQEPHVRVAP